MLVCLLTSIEASIIIAFFKQGQVVVLDRRKQPGNMTQETLHMYEHHSLGSQILVANLDYGKTCEDQHFAKTQITERGSDG